MFKCFFERTRPPVYPEWGLWIGPLCQDTYYIKIGLGRLFWELHIGANRNTWPWGTK